MWRICRKSLHNTTIIIPHLFLQLVIDASLSSLPRRQTDGAIIVRSQDKNGVKAKAFKLNGLPCEPILVERFVPINLCLRQLTLNQGREAVTSGNIDFAALG